jgi:hypothetical protein
MLGKKTDGLLENLKILKLIFIKFPYSCPTNGLPHGILHVFNTILYENEIQNPQIFQQTITLSPEQSTLICSDPFYGQASGPRPTHFFAGRPQIGCGTG